MNLLHTIENGISNWEDDGGNISYQPEPIPVYVGTYKPVQAMTGVGTYQVSSQPMPAPTKQVSLPVAGISDYYVLGLAENS